MLIWTHERQLAKVIDLEGRFDKVARRKFDASIKDVLTGRYSNVVFNFSPLSFIDSSGLGKIALAYLDLKRTGVEVTIVGLPPKIRRLLDRHGLSRLFSSADSVGEFSTVT